MGSDTYDILSKQKKNLTAAIKKNDIIAFSNALDSIRESAINKRHGTQWYLEAISEASNGGKSEDSSLYRSLNDLYMNAIDYLNHMSFNSGNVYKQREKFLNTIREVVGAEGQRIQPESEEYAYRFYFQHFLADVVVSEASLLLHIYELLGRYYLQVDEWNHELGEDEEFIHFFGQAALDDIIVRTAEDLMMSESYQNPQLFSDTWVISKTSEKQYITKFTIALYAFFVKTENAQQGKKREDGKGSASSQQNGKVMGHGEGHKREDDKVDNSEREQQRNTYEEARDNPIQSGPNDTEKKNILRKALNFFKSLGKEPKGGDDKADDSEREQQRNTYEEAKDNLNQSDPDDTEKKSKHIPKFLRPVLIVIGVFLLGVYIGMSINPAPATEEASSIEEDSGNGRTNDGHSNEGQTGIKQRQELGDQKDPGEIIIIQEQEAEKSSDELHDQNLENKMDEAPGKPQEFRR